MKPVHKSWGRTRPACGLDQRTRCDEGYLSTSPHAGRVRPQGQRILDQGLEFERLLYAQASSNYRLNSVSRRRPTELAIPQAQDPILETRVDCAPDRSECNCAAPVQQARSRPRTIPG